MSDYKEFYQSLTAGQLGKKDARFNFSSAEELTAALTSMVKQGHQIVRIFSHSLDIKVFDDAKFLDALTKLAIGQRASRVQVLIRDPFIAVRNNHRLIELSQRFSSSIEVRRIARDYADRSEEFVVIDDLGVIHRSLYERYWGSVNFYERERLAELINLFKGVWEASTPETEFRRLHI